jgi:hypothetical protein
MSDADVVDNVPLHAAAVAAVAAAAAAVDDSKLNDSELEEPKTRKLAELAGLADLMLRPGSPDETENTKRINII